MTYRFGELDLWRERYELRRGAAPVALEPLMFEVRAYLWHAGDACAVAGRVLRALDCLDKALRNGFHHLRWGDVVPGFAFLRRDTRVRRGHVGAPHVI